MTGEVMYLLCHATWGRGGELALWRLTSGKLPVLSRYLSVLDTRFVVAFCVFRVAQEQVDIARTGTKTQEEVDVPLVGEVAGAGVVAGCHGDVSIGC